MKMLQIILLILTFITLLVFLFSNKKFSFLFLYYLSSCLYYSNSYIGHSFISSNNHISGFFSNVPIHDTTYILLIINMLCILFFAIFSGKELVKVEEPTYYNHKNRVAEKYAIKCLILMNTFLSFLALGEAILSIFNHNYNKLSMLEASGNMVSYFKSISTILFIYIFTQTNIKYKKIDYFLIIYCMVGTMILGHRSYLVIALLGIIIFKMNDYIKKNKMNLFLIVRTNILKVLLIFLVFMTFIISKNIYTSLFNGKFDLVKARLVDPEYYLNSFKLNEFNSIFINLDTVVKTNYSYPMKNYIRAGLVFIPMANRFVPITSFSQKYQYDLFGMTNRAGTFMGEAYACGRIILVCVVIFIILCFLLFLDNRIYLSKNNMVKTFFIIAAVDFSFYIHRNCLEVALTRVRSYIYILFLYFVIMTFLKKLVNYEK